MAIHSNIKIRNLIRHLCQGRNIGMNTVLHKLAPLPHKNQLLENYTRDFLFVKNRLTEAQKKGIIT